MALLRWVEVEERGETSGVWESSSEVGCLIVRVRLRKLARSTPGGPKGNSTDLGVDIRASLYLPASPATRHGTA